MKHVFIIISIFITLLLIGQSCKHDPVIPDDIVIPPVVVIPPLETGNCSPDTVYFERDVLPLLKSNCALSGCHDHITKEDGVELTSYTTVVQTADVQPFMPDESEIIDVLTETDPDKLMPPPPATTLTQDQINIITKWIQQGAKNWTCTESSCDTTDVRFSNTIGPIIQNKCSGCHSGASPQGGLTLTNHGEISTIALDGRLLNSLRGLNGFMLMPNGGPALPDCEIQQIELWVNDGAPNN